MTYTMIEKELGSELMLYDIDRDEVHILNKSAGIIYRCIMQGKSVEEIREELGKRFRAEETSRLYQDILQCLTLLEGKGILKDRPHIG